MKNKQKAWRRKAHDVKVAAVLMGRHVKGARYGRLIKGVMVKTPGFTSALFQRLAIRAGIIKGETA